MIAAKIVMEMGTAMRMGMEITEMVRKRFMRVIVISGALAIFAFFLK